MIPVILNEIPLPAISVLSNGSSLPKILSAKDSVRTMVPGSLRAFSGDPARNLWVNTLKMVESAKYILSSKKF